jgi:hypothetical protein
MLQTGRWRLDIEFLNLPNPSGRTRHWGSASNRNETRNKKIIMFLGSKVRRVSRADNHIGLHGLLREYLYLHSNVKSNLTEMRSCIISLYKTHRFGNIDLTQPFLKTFAFQIIQIIASYELILPDENYVISRN